MKYILLPLFLLTACADDSVKVYQYKKEVLDAELAFALMADEKGIEAAFMHYASPEAVLMCNESSTISRSSFE